MMPAPWKGTGGGPACLSGIVCGPPGRSLGRKLLGATRLLEPCAVCLACWSHLIPRVSKQTRTASSPHYFGNQATGFRRPKPQGCFLRGRVGGDASCIFISTWNRGPRAHACVPLPAPAPARGSDLESTSLGCRRGGIGGHQTLTARPLMKVLWGSLGVPSHHHKLTSKASCLYVFKEILRTKILTHRLTPPRSFSVVLPSSTTFSFFARG